VIARIGDRATSHRVVTAPTSHVDVVPTLLGAAGTDMAAALAELFSEVHPLPGRDLMPVVDGASADDTRAVYLMTRDNILDGDSGASVAARRLKRTANPPGPLRIRVPAGWSPISRDWWSALTTSLTARAICGSWCAPSMIRRPGPNQASVTSLSRPCRTDISDEPA
jgi:arylsulfatase A-like enzyme